MKFGERFVEKMNGGNFVEQVLRTDEAHFQLDGTFSNSNYIICAKENRVIFNY
jgi:hypothetical protein